MTDPWAFGWTQLLTIFGLLITLVIGGVGLRTFGKWRREKVEEAKINAAIEGLALAYEGKFVFEQIRSPIIREDEWADMEDEAVSREERRRLGSYYAVFKRIEAQKDFFERLWKLQPRFMAIFGSETEENFALIHGARRDIQIAAEMLASQRREISQEDHDKEFWIGLRADIWVGREGFGKDADRIGRDVLAFQAKMEHICHPVIGRYYHPEKESHWESFLWALKNH